MDLLKNFFKGDKAIWIIFLFLCLISIVEVFSASSTLTYKSGDHWGPITNHLTMMLVGGIIVWVVHNIPCRWFKTFVALLPISWILLITVFIIGTITNGARRWIDLGFIQFQPSEIAKMATIISVAFILSKLQEENGANKKAFKYILWVTAITCGLIFTENLSKFNINEDAQIAHANIAIATSNILGKGPGNSVQRDFLSQAFSDFIYAIIIEELGLVGGAFVAILYLLLLMRIGRIARNCDKPFYVFLIMGIGILIATQALFNMLVAVGIMPVTGQPLPLISKGGTSTLVNCIYIGMILSISRYVNDKKQQEEQEKAGQPSLSQEVPATTGEEHAPTVQANTDR